MLVLASTLAAVLVAEALSVQEEPALPSVRVLLVVNDVQASLEEKRAILRRFVKERGAWNVYDASDLVAIVSKARPVDHQFELCLDLQSLLPSSVLPTRTVRLEATDSWGAYQPAVMVERGVVVSILPFEYSALECLPGVHLRFVASDADEFVPFDGSVARLRTRGPGNLVVLQALAQVSNVSPAERPNGSADVSAGVRVGLWRRWFHVELGVKLSTFQYEDMVWVTNLPAGLSFDAFVGLAPVLKWTPDYELRLALEAGVWSSLCAALRATLLTRFHHWVVELNLASQVYPMAFVPAYDRPTEHRALGFADYVFFSVGLGVGYSW